MRERTFYIIAGEPSGDRHAAELARALVAQDAGAGILGVGGRHLKAAGQEQLFDLAEHAVVGLVDVLKNYFKFRRFFYRILADIRENQPDTVILVDFPGFNLRLSARLRKEFPNLRQVYYIAPQVWAWKRQRVRRMQKNLDLLLVIFSFEKEWFSTYAPDLVTHWVGHPTLDEWDASTMPSWESREPVLLLLPGSRKKEIEAHLPVFMEGIRRLHPRYPELEFLLIAPDSSTADWIRGKLSRFDALPPLRVEDHYCLSRLSQMKLAWVSSGTATLECAMAGVPLLVVYKTQPLTWWVGRQLVKIKYLSMVNIVAGEKVVPEFLQNDAQPEILEEATCRLLKAPARMKQIHDDLVELTGDLKGSGASAEAARLILEAG